MTGLTPVAVSAEMEFHDDDKRVDAAASISVEFDNGVVGSIDVSGRTHRFSERVQVWTDDGGVSFDENAVTKYDDGGTYRPDVARHAEPNKVEAFIDALQSGERPPATARTRTGPLR